MDEEQDTLPNHLFISLRHEFKTTRVIDQRLSPAIVKFKVDVSTLDEDTDDYAMRMEVAMAKMDYWVKKILNGSIIISADNEWALQSFMDGPYPVTSNMVVLCPEEPTDALLCEILICKFKALAAGAFDFHAIDIESTDGRGMGFTFVGQDPGGSFPDDKTWLTETNYFSRPWWHRGDASSLDCVPDGDEDLNEPPSWAYSMSFIADDLAEADGVDDSHKVVRPEFRPHVIDGGKK